MPMLPQPLMRHNNGPSKSCKNKRKVNATLLSRNFSNALVKTRKECDPNLSSSKIYVLLDLKKEEWLEEQELEDTREHAQPECSRRTKISSKFNVDPTC